MNCHPLSDVIPKRTNSLAVVEAVLSRFILSHCRNEDNRECLPGPPCNSSRKGATRSEQAASWARTRSCSRNPNLGPNSKASELPPSTSRVDPREDPKRSLPLDPDTDRERSLEGYEGQTVLCPSAYVNLQSWGLTWGEKRYRWPFVSTPCNLK